MPDIISPIDGQPAYHFDLLGDTEVDERLALAAATSRAWRDAPLDERISLCRGMLAAYAASADENAQQITRMMGKPIAQARGEFERTMVERVEHLCDVAA